jgi:hypothetical protein
MAYRGGPVRRAAAGARRLTRIRTQLSSRAQAVAIAYSGGPVRVPQQAHAA